MFPTVADFDAFLRTPLDGEKAPTGRKVSREQLAEEDRQARLAQSQLQSG